MLFVPGHDERKVRGALRSSADAVILDLEDGVAPGQKASARELVRRFLASPRPGGGLTLVRVNHPETDEFAADLDALPAPGRGLDGVVMPKATPAAMAELPADVPALIGLIETADGLRQAYETARTARVQALMLGGEDLGDDLRIEHRPDGLELLHARSRLVVDSAAAGIAGPIDVVHLDVGDADALRAEAELARSLGMAGKACIHPAQVDVVAQAFAPSPTAVLEARAVLEAFERSDGGVALVDGRMVDAPVAARARRILARAAGPAEPRTYEEDVHEH